MSLPARRVIPTPAAMHSLAAEIARILRPGDVVLLSGPLGAGKTTFAQGVGLALGAAERLTSPTFVIARMHPARIPIVHVDAYRLGGAAELDDLDLDAELEDVVTLVEWGRGLAEQLSGDRLEIDIERAQDPADHSRTVWIQPVGPRWETTDIEEVR